MCSDTFTIMILLRDEQNICNIREVLWKNHEFSIF